MRIIFNKMSRISSKAMIDNNLTQIGQVDLQAEVEAEEEEMPREEEEGEVWQGVKWNQPEEETEGEEETEMEMRLEAVVV